MTTPNVPQSVYVESEFMRTHAALTATSELNVAAWPDLEHLAAELSTAGHAKSVAKWMIDLSRLSTISSGGMAFLLKLWRELQLRAGAFVLACPAEPVRGTIEASGMSRHWTLTDSKDAALKQLGLRTDDQRSGSGIFSNPFAKSPPPVVVAAPAPAAVPAAGSVERGSLPGMPAIPNGSAHQHESVGLQQELLQVLEIAGPAAFVDLLFDRAFTVHATDIHLDPHEDGMSLRLRIDGLMRKIAVLPMATAVQAISRIKLMAHMDITEKRLSQDGHISHPSKRHRADVRIGSGPTVNGERLVLRLMPDPSHFLGLKDLGLAPDQAVRLEKAVAAPSGMMLFVGPVGSGKSTSTYTCLSMLNQPNRSVVTIEDPVERRVHGVSQIQIEPKIEFGFPEALRGVLRQDPDVIMVGEIRDAETAGIAVRASLTGIRVLSTIHASDAAATFDVLRQFGIPPMFIADSLNCVVAQRLVRKVCEVSREWVKPDAAQAALLKLDPAKIETFRVARGVPAEVNFHTGYNGRTGIYEVMGLENELRLAVLANESGQVLAEVARRNGMLTLEESAIQKILAGVTTVEEMLRVLTL